jgi:hypothetical protein
MKKLIVQSILIVIYIGIYPIELQVLAPSIFLIIGILLFNIVGAVVEKVK